MTMQESFKNKYGPNAIAPAEKKIDLTVERIIWGSVKARGYHQALGPRPIAAKKFSELLKNPTYQIFGLTNDRKQPVGYYAIMLVNDNNSMIIHHAESFTGKSLNRESTMLLLDHTGCDYVMGIGEDDDTVSRYTRMGFKLIENNWCHPTALYQGLKHNPHIQDVSGLEMLTEEQVEQLQKLVAQTIYEEGQFDPLERNIFREVMPEEVIERARGNQYRTLVWMDGKDIVGVVQLQFTEWREVVLTGVGVKYEFKGKRIGRNLMAAACEVASRSHTEILASTFSLNVPMEHLLGDVFKWRRLVGTYGVALDKEAVSWKRSKSTGSTAGHGQPLYRETPNAVNR